MKVKFYCDSGENIHSCRKATLDTVKDLGLDEGEGETLTEDKKYDTVEERAFDRLEIGYEE